MGIYYILLLFYYPIKFACSKSLSKFRRKRIFYSYCLQHVIYNLKSQYYYLFYPLIGIYILLLCCDGSFNLIGRPGTGDDAGQLPCMRTVYWWHPANDKNREQRCGQSYR